MNLYLEVFFVGVLAHAGLLLNAVLQNSFILLHGATGKPVAGITTVFCLSSLASAILGVYGIHHIVEDTHTTRLVLTSIGVVILMYHAYKSFLLSIVKHTHQKASYGGVIVAFSMVWLTPHIYTDMFIISSVAVQYDNNLYDAIVLGFTAMACIWFTSLALFSKKLSNLFNNPKSHKIMHLMSSIIFLVMVGVLIMNFFGVELHDH